MTRTYSDPSYGARRTISFITTDLIASTDETVGAHTFMFPCKVIDANICHINAATDLKEGTVWTLEKSLGGTGTLAAFGTADLLLATATVSPGDTVDCTVTETSFVAGDDVELVLDGEAAGGLIQVNLEVVEEYAQADS